MPRPRNPRTPLPTDADRNAATCRAYRERIKARKAAQAEWRETAPKVRHHVARDVEAAPPRASRKVCKECLDLPWRRPPEGCWCCCQPFHEESIAKAPSSLLSSASQALAWAWDATR